jgi:hypothetical protein
MLNVRGLNESGMNTTKRRKSSWNCGYFIFMCEICDNCTFIHHQRSLVFQPKNMFASRYVSKKKGSMKLWRAWREKNSHQHVRLWITPKSIYTSSLNFILFLFSKWISYSEWQTLSWNIKKEGQNDFVMRVDSPLYPLFTSILSQYQQFHTSSIISPHIFFINKL